MDPEQLKHLNREEEPYHSVPHISRQRKFFSQFSILPGPHPALRPNRNSTNTIVTVGDGSTPKNVLLQNNKTFAVKKFRMRSLLWVKPAGVAETSLPSTIAQLIPTLIINIAALSSGLSLGFSAIALPQLRLFAAQQHSNFTFFQPFKVDEETGSWIASMFGLGAIFGGFFSAHLSSKFGRRKAILMMALPDLIGWILICVSKHLNIMMSGRFLNGFAMAGYLPAIQVYVAEIAQPQHRGWLSSLTITFTALGTIISYGMGSAVSWYYVAVLGISLPLVLVAALGFIPDSPYWYMEQGDEKKALKVMERFRSKSSNVFSELLAVTDTFRNSGADLSFVNAVQEICKPQYLRPFLILNFLFFLMFFSGSASITFYAVEIFRMASSGPNEYLSAIIIGGIRLLGTLIFIPVVKFIPRKVILTITSMVMGISTMVLGFVMFSKEHSNQIPALTSIDWLPLFCVTIFMLADSIGLGSIPFLYIGEFFPSDLRSFLSGVTVSFANLMLFVAVKTFPSMCTKIGDSNTFWIYSSVCFAATVFTLIFVPETRGKSLQEIQECFGHSEQSQQPSQEYMSPRDSPLLSPRYPRTKTLRGSSSRQDRRWRSTSCSHQSQIVEL